MSQKNKLAKVLIAGGALAFSMSVAYAFDNGDAEKGEKVFKKCQSCHEIGENAENKSGPVLTGVIGRVAGTYEDYNYGKDLVAAGEAGLIWTDEELFEYLKDPKKYLRAKLDNPKAKSKMPLKLKKEKDRINVIAFLKAHSPVEETDEGAEGEAATTTE